MYGVSEGRVTRRRVVEGIGLGALGLAGAALLGCGSRSAKPEVTAAAGGGATTARRGDGVSDTLPLTAPKAQGKKRAGGTFVQPATSTYVQHDPHTALGGAIYHVIGEKGIEPHPVTNELLPHVLTSWEVADPSGTTLVFKVKQGLKIHNKAPWNGREFNAEDVAWNMERIGGLYAERLKIPKASFQRATMVGNIQKAQATDPYTVKVTLSKPNSSFFSGLMDTRVPFAPKEMDDIGWTDPLKMAGIGPFQVNEWVKDQKMGYVKYDQYFRPGEPSFDKFEYRVIPDRASTVAAFLSGQIQLLDGQTVQELEQIKRQKPDALQYTWVDSNWNHLRPGMEYAPFRDFRVRKAISLAIDYAGINDGFYGAGWAYQSSVHPGFREGWKPDKVKALPGFNPATKAADRAEGSKLLAAAGFPNGKGLELQVDFINIDLLRENSERFQAQMATSYPEMKVVLKPYADSASFSVPQAAGQFKSVMYVITAANDAVIDMISQYYTGGSRNYGKFTDKNLDAVLDKAQGELNTANRDKIMDEFQNRFMTEWMPMYVLCAQPRRVALPADVGGYDTSAGTWYGYGSLTKVCRWYYMDK